MKTMFQALSLLLALAARAAAAEPKTMPLWPEGAPGALGKETGDAFHAGDVPTLTVYPRRPRQGDRRGGRHLPRRRLRVPRHRARGRGGRRVAQLARASRASCSSTGSARSITTRRCSRTRSGRSGRSGARPRSGASTRSGSAILGFSAGGHLASTAATHFDAGKPDAADPIERQSCRPDLADPRLPGHRPGDPVRPHAAR